MAWQDEAIPALRVIINDLSETPTYSDGRLEQLLVVAAKFVNHDLQFDDYTISISDCTISPDPSNDDVYMNFIVLKAGCITDEGLLKTKAYSAGIVARCGPAMLDTVQHLAGFKELLQYGPCKAYTELKKQWLFNGNMVNVFRAVLGPFVSNDFRPEDSGFYLYKSDYYR